MTLIGEMRFASGVGALASLAVAEGSDIAGTMGPYVIVIAGMGFVAFAVLGLFGQVLVKHIMATIAKLLEKLEKTPDAETTKRNEAKLRRSIRRIAVAVEQLAAQSKERHDQHDTDVAELQRRSAATSGEVATLRGEVFRLKGEQ